MKTHQRFMRATFTGKRADNARGSEASHNLLTEWQIIDKKTERSVITCRTYTKGRGDTVHASLWVHRISDKAKPASWEHGETSGRGSAGGYGYHKASAAVCSAISSAGITLWGSPYARPVNGDSEAATRKLLKHRAHIGGCGDSSIESALCAIAYAAGFNNAILVR
jgi:hypothetical protein